MVNCQRIVAPDCALLLWAVHSHLPDALAVICAWGFTYKTVAFTWVKRTPRDTGYFLGRGYWTHSNAEVCLLATMGRPARVGTGVPSLVVTPRREHSRKPDEVRERIVRVFGDVPRAELFARQKVAGWSAWGNEVECDFSLGAEERNQSLPYSHSTGTAHASRSAYSFSRSCSQRGCDPKCTHQSRSCFPSGAHWSYSGSSRRPSLR